MGILGLGLQGIIDNGIQKATKGVFNGVGGFVTGTGRGLVGASSNAFNKTGIGKVTSAIGHGTGKAVGATAIVTATGAATLLKPTTLRNVGHTIGQNFKYVKDMSYGIFRAGTKDVTQEMIEKGYPGIGKRIVNAPTAYAITAGAITLGAMDGMAKTDYNFGLKYVTNGPMDTQGVSLTPGSVNPSYTPVYGKKGNGLRDLGTDQIGFSLHNSRRTGQI